MARRGFPLGPLLAHSSLGRRRPSDQIRRSSGSSARTKQRRRRPPLNPRSLSPSPFSLHATQRRPERPWRLGKRVAGAAVGPLAGARAPPVRERAAVERPGGGALSPRARALVPPASRTASGCLLWSARLARAALIRPAQVRPWVTHRPSKSGVPFPLGLGFETFLSDPRSSCFSLTFVSIRTRNFLS